MSTPSPLHPQAGAPSAASVKSQAVEPPSAVEDLKRLGDWFLKNRLAALFLLGIAAIWIYFYGVYEPYFNYSKSALIWAHEAWNGSQEFGRLVPIIAAGLVFVNRHKLVQAKGEGSFLGLPLVLLGLFIFFISVRTVQPRIALASIPFLIYGSVLYTAGRKAAGVIFFPAVFLFFMIPVAALEQATFSLQFVITKTVGALSQMVGIGIEAMGTNLVASNGTFRFEIAEGCSGINSLTAMTMLTAAYVHLTQDRLWKKIVIFLCSLLFAIIGNIGRIFTIILVARFYDPDVASGLYHDWSGYVFFPIAVVAMLLFSKLLNWKKKPRETATAAA